MPAASVSGAVPGAASRAACGLTSSSVSRTCVAEALGPRAMACVDRVGHRGDAAGTSPTTVPARDGRSPRSRASKVVTVADWKRGLRRVLYPAYEARVLRRMPADRLPKHVGVMLDGNRRWARAVGADAAHGHRAGAANIEPLLGWCDEARRRGRHAVAALHRQPQPSRRRARAAARRSSRTAVDDARRRSGAGGSTRWARSTCCPPRPPSSSRRPRRRPATSTGMLVNVAVGYGGRREIADAVRSLLQRARRAGHARSRSSPRSSTSSTSPSTSTPRASPTPTW